MPAGNFALCIRTYLWQSTCMVNRDQKSHLILKYLLYESAGDITKLSPTWFLATSGELGTSQMGFLLSWYIDEINVAAPRNNIGL